MYTRDGNVDRTSETYVITFLSQTLTNRRVFDNHGLITRHVLGMVKCVERRSEPHITFVISTDAGRRVFDNHKYLRNAYLRGISSWASKDIVPKKQKQNHFYFKVFHSVHSCKSNTSTLFQRNENWYLIRTFTFIASLLHVSVFYIRYLQGEYLITCTKPFIFLQCCVCYIDCVRGFKIVFKGFLTHRIASLRLF
jgi:hypothetical protein